MGRALLLTVLTAAILAGPAPSATWTAAVPPSADLSFPFGCDWGYDWESRCFREDGARLPLGGAGDKMWRAGLRFPLSAIPAGATVTSAELRVRYDGVCVAPARGWASCAAPGAVIDAHRVLSARWLGEREPELDARVVDTAVVFEPTAPQWLVWQVTSLVRAWHSGLLPNLGVLLKLQDGDEAYDVPGPYVPSSSYPDANVQPRLIVTWVEPAR
jgi:hypothetical protein